MLVHIRLLCADLPVPAGTSDIELEDSATVEQALTAFLAQNPVDDPENKLPQSMFIVSKKPAKLDTVLRDRDEVLVLRVLNGG